jgi:hypothetical protein
LFEFAAQLLQGLLFAQPLIGALCVLACGLSLDCAHAFPGVLSHTGGLRSFISGHLRGRISILLVLLGLAGLTLGRDA